MLSTPPSPQRTTTLRDDAPILFFRSFLKRPKEVGSVIPSSRFLERRIVRCAELNDAKVVVELGPGTGGTTQALLRAMAPDAQLLAIEINQHLAKRVRDRFGDARLVVHCGSATDIAGALAEHDLPAPDVVISGIPFSTMSPALGRAILEAVRDALAPGGRFVAYQLRDRVAVLGRQVFGRPQRQLELRNVPPMRVWSFEKP
jgi:phosphatidylethanolamine/phosphatidyl-N-methylethanolamine N-methyltransferase